MKVCHVVLDDDNVENLERWITQDNLEETVEEMVQSMVDDAIHERLELELNSPKEGKDEPRS